MPSTPSHLPPPPSTTIPSAAATAQPWTPSLQQEGPDALPPVPVSPDHAALQAQPPVPPLSPNLTALVPARPVRSSKPWNCITQHQIDTCANLIKASSCGWSPKNHKVFTPTDRIAILELLRVGKRLEQEGGVFLDVWPYVLSFCGRGWFLDESKRTVPSLPNSPNRMGMVDPPVIGRAADWESTFTLDDFDTGDDRSHQADDDEEEEVSKSEGCSSPT